MFNAQSLTRILKLDLAQTPTLVQKRFVSYFKNPDPSLRGAIVSVYQGGAWLGSASVGFTSDRMGRRKAIAFGCVFGALGGILMTAAAHVAMLIVGRLCVGYAVGTITVSRFVID